MNKLFVTGLNGLLGTNLCHELLEQGYTVKGLIRNKNKYRGRLHPRLELIEGDLTSDFAPILQEVDGVIHIAAITDQSLPTYEAYWRVNYLGTVKLIQAAVQSRVGQFIFVSTANTMGYGSASNPGNERSRMKSPFQSSFYAKSKWEAEQYLLSQQNKIQAVIINPTFMLGRYDSKPSSGKIIMMAWRKKVVFYPPGGKNFVHVEDVAKGIVSSLTHGKSGERYLIGNENLSYQHFFKKVNSITDQRPLMVKIPRVILLGLGLVGDLLQKLRIRTSLSSVNMRILCIDNYFSNQKSQKALAVQYHSVDQAITDAVRYFSSTPQN